MTRRTTPWILASCCSLALVVSACGDHETTSGDGDADPGGTGGTGASSSTTGGSTTGGGGSGVSADVTKWHTFTLEFQGPEASETDDGPNPFLDLRLQVLFTGPSGQAYDVPGFFAGDGDGGEIGSTWRVRFTPDEEGSWQYEASFRQGTRTAIKLDPEAGEPTGFDGETGTFTVGALDGSAPGFLKWGRLEYVGSHYLRFRDGSYWIRGGTDSPENLLAYADFDDTLPSHRYEAHEQHWQAGDPTWGDGRGKGLIGALNYLSSKQVNSVYLMPHNVGGDGQDAWPWADPDLDPTGSPDNDNLHYDVSKLDQWNIVFEHAQQQGLFLHVVLNEAEQANKRELDDGELGPERKLYYREMIARFGHHLAMQWNLSEEFNVGAFKFDPEHIREFADYVAAVDPYDHPITVHNGQDPMDSLSFMFGDERFGMTSIQLGQQRIDTMVEQLREATASAARPLPISMDEFVIDLNQDPACRPRNRPKLHRIQKLWPVYFSGGMVEFILEDVLATDAFDTPDLAPLWDYVAYARSFMEDNLPFWEMEPADDLVSGEGSVTVGGGPDNSDFQLRAQVFAKAGEIYAVYLPKASPSGSIDLSEASGSFELRWYNPREGSFEGPTRTVSGGATVPLGDPPADPDADWVVLIAR